MTYGSTQGDFRFSVSLFLCFSGSPFLRFSVSPVLRPPLPPLPPFSLGGEGGNGKPEKRRNGETKITLCGTIGHLPLRGRCPTYSEKNNKN